MRILLLSLLALLHASTAAASGETIIRDLKNTKVIRSNEQPHNILDEACLACHPKEKFEFWLLIYKGKSPTLTIDRPEERRTAPEAAAAAPAAPKNRYNSHDSIGCNFCHFDSPTGTAPKFIVDIRDLCNLCHPGVVTHELPTGDDLARVQAAIANNALPGAGGKILCTTCHKLHDSTYGIRETYFQLLWKEKVPNPHGKKTFCYLCHPGRIKEGAEVRLGEGRDNIKLCNDCHSRPGIKASPHVVEATSSESTWRMDYLGYPLNQGKLICSTCHDEVSHGKADPANPKFLRGGPYEDPEKFCYRCHLEERGSLSNPHNQVDPFGRIREESCRFCHKNAPDQGRSGDWNLAMVGEESTICSNCHQYKPHPDVDHNRPLTQKMNARRVEYEQKRNVTIPVGEGGVVTCSTCHNPHGKGVLKGEAGVGAGSKWRVPDFREVCAPCHGRY